MGKLTVQKVARPDDRKSPLFEEFDAVADRVRHRAYDLFVNRGFGVGRDLDDWLHAERELGPVAELIEEDGDYVLNVQLAGFDSKDISVTATPHELLVKAASTAKQEKSKSEGDRKVHWSEFRTDNVYRRVALPSAVDVKSITAKLDDGILTIRAPVASGKSRTAAGAKKKGASAKKPSKKKVARKKASKASKKTKKKSG